MLGSSWVNAQPAASLKRIQLHAFHDKISVVFVGLPVATKRIVDFTTWTWLLLQDEVLQ
jgi:hypothetical protein